MKKLSLVFALTIAAFLSSQAVADAQVLKNLLKQATSSTTTTESAGTTNGKAACSALKSLYTQYKADGKLDMSNLNNIMNAATLATNVKGLKGQTDKTAFYKDFASGLILGSENLVTAATSSTIMNGLSNLANNVDLSSLTETATTAATNAATSALTNAATSAVTKVVDSETTSAISNILSLLK